jgi:uncharacterized membrane protein
MTSFVSRTLSVALVCGSLCSAFPAAAQESDAGTDHPTAANVTPRNQGSSYESAWVKAVRLDTVTSTQTGQLRQLYEIELLGGDQKGKLLTISSDVEANPYQLDPRVGDRVVISIQPDDKGEAHYYLEGFDRRGALMWLVILFVLTLVLLAGKQGLKVALSILLSILVIGWVLIPAFLRGANPVPIAMLLAGVLTFISTGLSTGWNRQSVITAIGTMGGVIVAYGISVLFSDWAHLSGLATEEDRLFFDQNPLLNPRGLLFAGIIIASMGVVEDVAVSIASGAEQVWRANHRISFKELFRSAMIIGKDHMSALANTLVFAYVGASLSTLLLYTQYGGSWLKFLNFDVVADEVVRSLAGTIGLIFTVPITALLAAWVLSKRTADHTK